MDRQQILEQYKQIESQFSVKYEEYAQERQIQLKRTEEQRKANQSKIRAWTEQLKDLQGKIDELEVEESSLKQREADMKHELDLLKQKEKKPIKKDDDVQDACQKLEYQLNWQKAQHEFNLVHTRSEYELRNSRARREMFDLYKEGVADQLQLKINEIEQTYQKQVESLKKQISDVKKEGQQRERQFQEEHTAIVKEHETSKKELSKQHLKELKAIRQDFHEQQGVTTILSSIKELAAIAGLDEPKKFSLDILRAQLRGVADVVNGKRPTPPEFVTPPPKRVCVKPLSQNVEDKGDKKEVHSDKVVEPSKERESKSANAKKDIKQAEDKMETEPRRLETAEEDEGSSIEVEPDDQDDGKGSSEKSAKSSKSKDKNENAFLSDSEMPDAAKPEEVETAEELEDANDKESEDSDRKEDESDSAKKKKKKRKRKRKESDNPTPLKRSQRQRKPKKNDGGCDAELEWTSSIELEKVSGDEVANALVKHGQKPYMDAMKDKQLYDAHARLLHNVSYRFCVRTFNRELAENMDDGKKGGRRRRKDKS